MELVIERICFECDHRYVGGLLCPKCGCMSGEPLPTMLKEED